MHAYNPNSYVPQKLDEWIAIAERQAPKDRILIPRIAKLFGPGDVLELGSATGHIAQILQSLGRRVVTSDYAQFFVDYMLQKGLDAHRIDATDIKASGIWQFPNIFCQSITPFITDDLAIASKAYRSVFETLLPGGRIVLIHAMATRDRLKETMKAHESLAKAAGFADVRVQRDQLLPTIAYAKAAWLASPLDATFAPLLGSRFVLSGSKRAG